MDTPDDLPMSASEIQELTKRLAEIRGACIILGVVTGILASALTAFGGLWYQQSSLQRDTMNRLVQQVADMPNAMDHERRIAKIEAKMGFQ